MPRVERGEFLNVGVVLFAPELEFLGARMELDRERVRALAPDVDLDAVERHLRNFLLICSGSPEGGPLAALPRAQRFHWLVAPRSTMIQTSPVHMGRTDNPPRTLAELVDELVLLRPAQAVDAVGA